MTDAGTDVVIVGGGPAGGAAAILLARFGYSCFLVERRASGTPRLCGEFLSPESLPILRTLSVDEEVHRASLPEIESVRVTAGGGLSWEGRLPWHGFGISRRSLEEALLGRAASLGVRIMLGGTVRRWVRETGDGWMVDVDGGTGPRIRLRARAVVRATGRDGTKPVGPRARDRFVAYQAHFDGPSLQGRVELHGFRGGYAGLIDVEGGRRNLCLLARPTAETAIESEVESIPESDGQPAHNPATSPNRPEMFLATVARSSPSFAAWLDGARRASEWTSASAVGLSRESPVLDDGTLALGDAAGLIAPFAGDGRSMALRSAEIAAPILHEHLSGRISLRHAGTTWRRAWRQEFGGQIRSARILNRILIHPSTLSIFLRVLRAVPPLGALTIASTRGRAHNGNGGLR